MKAKNENVQKILLWMMGLSSLTGILIWYYQRLSAAPLSAWLTETIELWSFFTITTNSLIVIMAATLLLGRGRLYAWFQSPTVQSAFCLYIVFMGLAFWFVLGGPGNLATAQDWIADICDHTLSPILGAIFWFFAVPKGHLKWQDSFRWLVYPIAYLVYWMFRGPLVGEYPYFFLDVNELGYAGVARWAGILMVALIVLGLLMWGVDRWQAGKDQVR